MPWWHRALALATSSAAAAPQGSGLITEPGFDCGDFGDPVTIVHSHGNSGWVDQDHYVVTSASGYEGDELVFTKSFGTKPRSAVCGAVVRPGGEVK